MFLLLIIKSLGCGVVWVIDVADADAVLLRNVERLYLVALGEAAYTPLGYAGILQVLRYGLRTLDRQTHVDGRVTRLLVSIARQADECLRMLVQVLQQTAQFGHLVGADDALVDNEVDVHVERDLLHRHVNKRLCWRCDGHILVDRLRPSVAVAEVRSPRHR